VSLLGLPQEANRWLARFIRTYNLGDHRTERHSRIDDWLAHLPAEGIRQMCAWERFCMFARELVVRSHRLAPKRWVNRPTKSKASG
jgi:hypothetical protein